MRNKLSPYSCMNRWRLHLCIHVYWETDRLTDLMIYLFFLTHNLAVSRLLFSSPRCVQFSKRFRLDVVNTCHNLFFKYVQLAKTLNNFEFRWQHSEVRTFGAVVLTESLARCWALCPWTAFDLLLSDVVLGTCEPNQLWYAGPTRPDGSGGHCKETEPSSLFFMAPGRTV